MSDSPKHTPGPWYSSGGHVFRDTRELVCCARGGLECCGNPDVVGEYHEVAQTSERDAPLIAAAPDMLDALEVMDAYLYTTAPNSNEHQIVQRVIAAARGKAA